MAIIPVSTTRRQVLKGAGSLALASTLGTRYSAARAQSAGYDIIVIGGGTAGLPLLVTAAEHGARVLLIEKSPVLGGTLDRSYASTSAAGSVLQKAAHINDSPQAHYDDIMRGARNVADPVLVGLWTKHAATTIDWLVANGITFDFMVNSPGGRSQMVNGHGKAIIKMLEPMVAKAVQSGRATVLYNSRAVELIQDGSGAVAGVVVEDEKGAAHDYRGRSVVLAAGGSMGNPSLYESLHKVPLYYNAGYPYNQGDSLLLGQSAGGHLQGGDAYIPIMGVVMSDDTVPSVPTGGSFQETTINPRKRSPYEIWVNIHGQRFVCEDTTVSQEAERALGQQPSHRLWTVQDQEAFDKSPSPMQGWDRDKYIAGYGSNPFFYKAQTLEQLAVKAGVDARGLENSVAQYNRALAEGAPDPLGRMARPAPIARAPFYGVRYQGYHLLTFAGLVVDEQLRVVRPDGAPVANLFAAGEVLGAMALGCCAHSTGAMVTPSLTFGRLLGDRLAKV